MDPLLEWPPAWQPMAEQQSVADHGRTLKWMDECERALNSQIKHVAIAPAKRTSTKDPESFHVIETGTSNPKTLITFERSNTQTVAKVDGKTVVFSITGYLSGNATNAVILSNGSRAGEVGVTDALDENKETLVTCTGITSRTQGQPIFNVLSKKDQSLVGTVSHNGELVALSIHKDVDFKMKVLLLSMFLKLAIRDYGVGQVLTLSAGYPSDGNGGAAKPPDSQSKQFRRVMGPLVGADKMLLRPVGHNDRELYYSELMDRITEEVKMTVEFLPNDGHALVKDCFGKNHLQISGLWEWNNSEEVVVKLDNGYVLGYIDERSNEFVDRDRNVLLRLLSQSSTESTSCICQLGTPDTGKQVRATISSDTPNLILKLKGALLTEQLALLVAFAVQLSGKLFGVAGLESLVDYQYWRKDDAQRLESVGVNTSEAVVRPAPVKVKVEAAEKEPPRESSPHSGPVVNGEVILSADRRGGVKAKADAELANFDGVSNMAVSVIGENERQVIFFKVTNLDKGRSFLTCEWMPAADNTTFNDRHGQVVFYVKHILTEQGQGQLYTSDSVCFGSITKNSIRDSADEVIFHATRRDPWCGQMHYTLETSSATLAAYITPEFSGTEVKIEQDCTRRQKALILGFAVKKSFAIYAFHRIVLKSIVFAYRPKKSAKTEQNCTPKEGNSDAAVVVKEAKSKATDKRSEPPHNVKDGEKNTDNHPDTCRDQQTHPVAE